ncbi:MAG: MotA/TolQ/ExbB proton channel family protein [Bdellovibrionales bacterium]|nr:MotA/TolQ/ExbB proton channel family protein [Bdellovibrionales bacterium]
MDSMLSFLNNYKIIDICIVLVGMFGLFIVADRWRALFTEYSLPAEPFLKQVLSLIEQDKLEEAITFCAANEKKPLAYVVKRVLEKSDRDDEAISSSLDIAASEVAPRLMKGLGHVSMVSNVVTLIGLLGTVVGLITAFRAVSFADVAQKQTLLAEGISIAMTATMLGLMFAIPVMIAYSFLHARQGRLFNEIDQVSQKVIEALKGRIYMPYKGLNAYPSTLNADGMKKTTTPPPSKAS